MLKGHFPANTLILYVENYGECEKSTDSYILDYEAKGSYREYERFSRFLSEWAEMIEKHMDKGVVIYPEDGIFPSRADITTIKQYVNADEFIDLFIQTARKNNMPYYIL